MSFLLDCLAVLFPKTPESKPTPFTCGECCNKTTEIFTGIQRTYFTSYRSVSHIPSATFSEPGCYLLVHEDGKVCCFSHKSLNSNKITEPILARWRQDLGNVTIDNQSTRIITYTIPQTDFAEETTLSVQQKSEKTFQLFKLW